MRNALPVITEDAATLKERLHRERDGRKRSRLQMLYLLASGQAQTRQDVAQLLGGHRHTISRWLARYDAGGLDASLALYVPLAAAPSHQNTLRPSRRFRLPVTSDDNASSRRGLPVPCACAVRTKVALGD